MLRKTILFSMLMILVVGSLVVAQTGIFSSAVVPLGENELVSVTGGINNRCMTTVSCSIYCRRYETTSRYCDGTSTDPWCACKRNYNCWIMQSHFPCGQKKECEDIYGSLMCGPLGDCTFAKADPESDDC
jgi:hypothetical protein